jgi:hypothetical protein
MTRRRASSRVRAWTCVTGVASIASCTYDFERFADSGAGPEALAGAAGRAGVTVASGADAERAGATSAGIDAAAAAGGSGGTGQLDGGGGSTSAAGGVAGAVDGSAGDGVGGGSVESGSNGHGGESGCAGAGGESAGTGGTGTGGSFDCDAVSGVVWSGHCYFREPAKKLTWEAARAACAAYPSGHLVAITSVEEQTLVERAFFPSLDDHWIGLSLADATNEPAGTCEDDRASCPFGWVTAEPLGYTNWARFVLGREPNYSGACVRLLYKERQWADHPCGAELPAVCEVED